MRTRAGGGEGSLKLCGASFSYSGSRVGLQCSFSDPTAMRVVVCRTKVARLTLELQNLQQKLEEVHRGRLGCRIRRRRVTRIMNDAVGRGIDGGVDLCSYSAVVRPFNDLPSGAGAEYAEKAKNLDQLDLAQEKLLQEQVTHIPIEPSALAHCAGLKTSKAAILTASLRTIHNKTLRLLQLCLHVTSPASIVVSSLHMQNPLTRSLPSTLLPVCAGSIDGTREFAGAIQREQHGRQNTLTLAPI